MKHTLGVPVLQHSVLKPGYSCIRDIQSYFQSLEHPILDNELVVVGDRIFTDIVLANRMRSKSPRRSDSAQKDSHLPMAGDFEGPLAILVEKLWKRDAFGLRVLENTLLRLVKRWSDKDIVAVRSRQHREQSFIKSFKA